MALLPTAITPEVLRRTALPHPALQALADELIAHWFGLLPGFHRLVLNQGQVLLTLCIGPRQSLLRAQQFLADAVLLDASIRPDTSPWDRWSLKTLSRCCRRGTTLTTTGLTPQARADLIQSGFELALDHVHGIYNPRWALKRTRSPWAQQHDTDDGPRPIDQSCVVIGAGLGGASVAAALARRGWQVEVLDGAPFAAMGASGLPVGLVVPHGSFDDSPRSRLSRAGVRLSLQQARQHLQLGQDWSPSGVLELRRQGTPGLPTDWPEPGRDWSQTAAPQRLDAPWAQGLSNQAGALWHPLAAWIKPAKLVAAWLAQPGICFRGEAHVAALRRQNGRWAVLGADQTMLTSAKHVVLASATGTTRLLQDLNRHQPSARLNLARLPSLQGIRGMVSWAVQNKDDAAMLPTFPVNGMGSLISNIPIDQGLAWYAGGSYEPDHQPPAAPKEHHSANHSRLQTLLPAVGAATLDTFANGHIQGWGQTRCASTDRLPLAGPLTAFDADDAQAPSLWISSAMGSRGLSYCVLCAELLAAQLNAEPLPVPTDLAKLLNPLRAK